MFERNMFVGVLECELLRELGLPADDCPPPDSDTPEEFDKLEVIRNQLLELQRCAESIAVIPTNYPLLYRVLMRLMRRAFRWYVMPARELNCRMTKILLDLADMLDQCRRARPEVRMPRRLFDEECNETPRITELPD